MSANVMNHLGQCVSDLERSRTFYSKVFGWTFAAWGPPGFYQIEAKGSPVLGALQGRRELVKGQRTIGFECTFAVDSIDATEQAVVAAGGKVVLARSVIVGVGTLMFFADPDGNAFGAMQYDPRAE